MLPKRRTESDRCYLWSGPSNTKTSCTFPPQFAFWLPAISCRKCSSQKVANHHIPPYSDFLLKDLKSKRKLISKADLTWLLENKASKEWRFVESKPYLIFPSNPLNVHILALKAMKRLQDGRSNLSFLCNTKQGFSMMSNFLSIEELVVLLVLGTNQNVKLLK